MDPVLDLASGYRVPIAHFFLKSLTVELSKCTIPSGECKANDRSPMRY
jgi:hypothetical protein